MGHRRQGALERDERLAAVGGLIGTGVGDVQHILVLGINFDLGKVAGSASNAAVVGIDRLPTLAAVVRAIESAVAGIDQGKDTLGITAAKADADAAGGFRQALGELPPGGAAVGRFEQATGVGFPGPVFPRSLTGSPENGIDRLRVGMINLQGDGTGVLVLVKDLFPRLAAVGRAEKPRSALAP